MIDSLVIYQIEPEDKELVVDILTAAFHNYPALNYFLGLDVPNYDDKLRFMVDFFCEARVIKGLPPFLVRDGEDLVAAALVNPAVSIPTPPKLKQAYREFVKGLDSAVIERLDTYEDSCHDMAPDEPHYYLGMIGVLPGRQGKGYAGRLLRHIHEIVDTDPSGYGICLNTEKAQNVPIYRHFGYEVISEADVGSIHTWCMFRKSVSSVQ